MNADEAADVAATCYAVPAAAAVLIVAATDPHPSEERLRAARALAWLDLGEELGDLALDVGLPSSDPLMPFALAVASIQVECIRHADQRERRRLANLLGAVCREAAEIARRRGARAAA